MSVSMHDMSILYYQHACYHCQCASHADNAVRVYITCRQPNVSMHASDECQLASLCCHHAVMSTALSSEHFGKVCQRTCLDRFVERFKLCGKMQIRQNAVSSRKSTASTHHPFMLVHRARLSPVDLFGMVPSIRALFIAL